MQPLRWPSHLRHRPKTDTYQRKESLALIIQDNQRPPGLILVSYWFTCATKGAEQEEDREREGENREIATCVQDTFATFSLLLTPYLTFLAGNSKRTHLNSKYLCAESKLSQKIKVPET